MYVYSHCRFCLLLSQLVFIRPAPRSSCSTLVLLYAHSAHHIPTSPIPAMQRFPTSATAPLTQSQSQVPQPQDLIPVGTFSPPLPTDLRSTCPILNALSNHGLVPRSGRDVSAAQLHIALRQIGVSPELAYLATLGNFVTSPPAAILKAGNAQAAHKDDKLSLIHI